MLYTRVLLTRTCHGACKTKAMHFGEHCWEAAHRDGGAHGPLDLRIVHAVLALAQSICILYGRPS